MYEVRDKLFRRSDYRQRRHNDSVSSKRMYSFISLQKNFLSVCVLIYLGHCLHIKLNFITKKIQSYMTNASLHHVQHLKSKMIHFGFKRIQIWKHRSNNNKQFIHFIPTESLLTLDGNRSWQQ